MAHLAQDSLRFKAYIQQNIDKHNENQHFEMYHDKSIYKWQLELSNIHKIEKPSGKGVKSH